MDRPVPQSSLKQERERTIRALCEHFARDRLEVEELERRLDVAHRAATVDELASLLSDLPVRQLSPRAQADALIERGSRAVREAVRDSRTLLALLGGVERRGQWTPARRNIVIAVMGGADLDFREVHLPAGETEVFVVCLMGGATLIVPPTLAVDAGGIAIMGGFEHASPPRSTEPDAPVLRVHGVCIMGGVDIQVRQVGESARDAQARVREEQRLGRPRGRLPRDRGRGGPDESDGGST
jgi:hypothetical protein